MRLWSLHPKYLDSKGLVALWREGLLAQAVLAGKTKGYLNHPQLLRFKSTLRPLVSIGIYLHNVCDEADHRGYAFDRKKILKAMSTRPIKIPVTRGQLKYEWEHLLKKLQVRDLGHLDKLKQVKLVRPHPSFKTRSGKVESWERA